tara:strand:- start:97194 stop:97760 length:567 start_codon:yes stop_codon:yes gene_type:complete
MMSSLRIKLRKTQTTLPVEKLTNEVTRLLVQSENLEKAPPTIAKMTQLISIEFQTPELNEFPEDLSNLDNLEVLKLKGQRTAIEKIKKTSSSIKTLFLVGMNLETFPNWILEMHELETLDLSKNHLTEIPKELSQLKKLNRINIDSNKLEKLPECFLEMPQLNHLSMDNNCFSVEEKANIQRKLGLWF